MIAADLLTADELLLQKAPASGAMPHDSGPIFVASWELDLSSVQSLIEGMSGGSPAQANWVEALLYGARISELNERAAQVVGAAVGRERMIGRPVASFAPPDSWATLAELIVEVATDRPNHALKSSSINSFLLDQAVLKVWGSPEDRISARIYCAVEGTIADDRSHWAVRASEARYRRLIHHLPTALLQADGTELRDLFHRLRADGVTDIEPYLDDHAELIETALGIVRVTDANQGAVALIGAESSEVLMGPIDYLFGAAPESARRVIIARFEGKRTHTELMKLHAFDGRILDIQLSITYPNPPERLDVTLITLEDVTDCLRTEAQLRQLQADYSRATRIATLGELASSIAHEVNQPLSAIAMNAETSLRWLSRDAPNLTKVTQLAARIADSARHASEIVQRIRGMAGRHVPERVLLDLNEVVNEALLFVHHDIEIRAISLSSDLSSGLPRIFGDRVQLQQVIVNLLVNAIQAVSQNSHARGRIEFGTGVDGEGKVFFSIRDNGPGLAPENLDRVFEGFFTTKDDGMGIGLAVCQSIIVAHGGSIGVANLPEDGAQFRFALPTVPAMALE